MTKKSPPKSTLEFRLEGLHSQFEEQALLFQTMMDPQRGGGIRCVAMLDCLRQLQFLYLDIAAHEHALKELP